MSTHPNVILLLSLKPDDLARKTYRAILDEAGVADDHDIKIDGEDYHHEVMENDYLDDYQITADKGDIILFDMVTYGYGERISWEKLEAQKAKLEAWAAGICERHKCKSAIYITANYW
jgi:hypothetical protein